MTTPTPGVPPAVPAGTRFAQADRWEARGTGEPHIWATLGYRRTSWEPGRSSIAWLATAAYSFPTQGGPVVQGGLVTALLDAAMGGACWTVLDDEQAFLTADLRVEFLRPSRPGELSATGWVTRRTRRVVFCAAELYDESGTLLAASRCTQVLLPDTGAAGRYREPGHTGAEDGPPLDGRG